MVPGQTPDEGIVPTQFVRPVAGSSIAPSTTINPQPINPSMQVNPVPVPVVSLDVILPQSAAATASIPCKLVIKNNANADAYNVSVRVPFSRLGASQVEKESPTPSERLADKSRHLTWKFPILRAGESKTITFLLKPDATIVNNGELGLKAFVTFEHGVEVVTKLGEPKLIVTKTAAKDAATNEAIPVSIQIRNQGTVPLHEVKLTETISSGFTFAEGTTGEETGKPEQRIWRIGTILPGETKSLGYRVSSKQSGELLAASGVNCTEGIQVTKDSITKVMNAALSVKLTGPRESSPGEAVVYTINVTNTGDLPMRNVKLSGSVPEGCRATRMTKNGVINRDRIDWVVPEIKPGTAYEVRFSLVGESTGKRVVTALATDYRGRESTDTRETIFASVADLHWETFADSPTIAVGKTGTFTVRVKNTGGDTARNVIVKMELPVEVRRTKTRPTDVKEGGQEIEFKAETIPPGATRDYVVEYKAEKAGRVYFNIRLNADSLGDKPMQADKMILINQARP